MRRLWSDISARAASWSVSADLAAKIRLGLGELTRVVREMSPLIAKASEPEADVIERSAACAMLHSFYTEIEKIFERIARDWDRGVPSSDSWHRELLQQMAAARHNRPAVISAGLLIPLKEFLAFRHLFRGASIMLMRWDKLSPLLAQVTEVHAEVVRQLTEFADIASGK